MSVVLYLYLQHRRITNETNSHDCNPHVKDKIVRQIFKKILHWKPQHCTNIIWLCTDNSYMAIQVHTLN